MKKFVALAIFAAMFLISACGAKTGGGGEDPGMTGYVVNIDNGRILVVDEKSLDFSGTGGLKEFYAAVWFSGAPDHVEIGDKVAVWHGAVAESYPGQSKVVRLEVLPPDKPEGADLAQDEALRRALEARSFAGDAAVRSIRYDAAADIWRIELRELLQGEQAVTLEIDDRP